MPLQDDYHVTLANFKGPLDLLLYLIRRAEVAITDIPIAEITDQYLAFIERIEEIDIDLAGEFLLMAATLIDIKARVLRPPGEQPEGESDDTDAAALDEADPRYELVQQLLAYQRYRIAAEELDRMRDEFARRFPVHSRTASDPDEHADVEPEPEPLELELEDAHLLDLFDAYERIISSIDFDHLGEHRIEYDDTPIGLHQDDLLDRLDRAPSKRITLQEAWAGRTRSEVIGLFLATLELVKLRKVLVRQEELTGEIVLELNCDPQAVGAADAENANEPDSD